MSGRAAELPLEYTKLRRDERDQFLSLALEGIHCHLMQLLVPSGVGETDDESTVHLHHVHFQ